MRTTCSSEAVESLQRRQSMTTWGILGLALFVSVGMAEWSKRQAAGETVIDPAVMEQAVKMAAAAAANVNVKVNVDESLGSGSRVAGGELPATSHSKHATLRSDSEATIQTSAGVDR